MAPPNPLLVLRLRRAGIRYPIYTVLEARRAKLALDIACAMLSRETGGGHMVWGHDPVPPGFPVGGRVTKAGYQRYKRLRVSSGNRHMQGCGGCQLTFYGYQDEADRDGGCWRPRPNLRVGFRVLADHVRRDGLHAGVAAYNGTGAAAQHYADAVLASSRGWAHTIGMAPTAGELHPVAEKPDGPAHGVPQTYLAKQYVWDHRPVQIATRIRDRVEAFMGRHPYCKVYEGFATKGHAAHSDHYCGYAIDIVPETQDARGKLALVAAIDEAKRMGAPYTELVWSNTNRHAHLSWLRCSR